MKSHITCPIKYHQFINNIATKEKLQIELLSPFSMDDTFHLRASISFKEIIQKSINKAIELTFLYCDSTYDIYKTATNEIESYLQQTLMSIDQIDIHFKSFSIPTTKKINIMPLVGAMGRVTYNGKFNFYLPLLSMIELIQIADKTTYGFGKIKLYYD